MWECNYGKEPLDIRLLVLRFLRRSPVILLAALLGVLCVGGPYFLTKVTFGPAKEYEAVTDFYIDYAVQESGEEYTYFNQTTWTQLITDDVFTDKILADMEEEAGITKQELQGYLYATMLSDTRIVTTTVTTNDPELTMRIERALLQAMEEFGKEQKEIAEVRILQEPKEASLVIADVRTFRACMLGAVIFVFVTVLYLLLYFVLDEGIHIPETFERRFGVPVLGTVRSGELTVLAERLLSGENASGCPEIVTTETAEENGAAAERQAAGKGAAGCPVLVTADEEADLARVRAALAGRGIESEACARLDKLISELFQKVPAEIGKKEPMARWLEGLQDRKFLLVVKAGAHNGKRIEKLLGFCRKCGLDVAAALLWEADEKLIRAYEMPEHVLRAWGHLRRREK